MQQDQCSKRIQMENHLFISASRYYHTGLYTGSTINGVNFCYVLGVIRALKGPKSWNDLKKQLFINTTKFLVVDTIF